MDLVEAVVAFFALVSLSASVLADQTVIIRTNKIVNPELSFSEELAQFLSTECRRDRMLVRLDFNTDLNSDRMTSRMSDLIWRGRICVNENNSNCCSHTDLVSRSLILSAPFERCGIAGFPHENGYKYVATMSFKTKSDVTTEHTISCLVPFKTNDLTAEFKFEEEAISMDSTLSSTVEVTQPKRDDLLQTYPLNCWLSFENKTSTEEQRRYFIVNGCPVNGSSARIQQEMATATLIKETRFRLPLYSFLSDLVDTTSPMDARLQCESILCSRSAEYAFENVPTCPRTGACIRQPELPLEARRTPLVPSERTLRILPSSGDKNKANEPSVSNCSQICAFEVASALLSVQQPPAPKCPEPLPARPSPNVSTGALVVVSLVSFVLGAALMAAMWYINVKTDPQRKVCTSTISTHRNLLLPPSYFDTTGHCPPYEPSKNVRTFVGSHTERQLLMR
ncbi:hypothetical protein QR680_017824 [Steinernema hermaphroditum]|uniref:ZP domain-containing protein n=1 Tax=Steinernema hermaphroditum TaxID=289476 RepID=A0AA39HIC2_9BILA|nr:hypothetical protein QR680_017824 [Steinernema hermaphroditum]